VNSRQQVQLKNRCIAKQNGIAGKLRRGSGGETLGNEQKERKKEFHPWLARKKGEEGAPYPMSRKPIWGGENGGSKKQEEKEFLQPNDRYRLRLKNAKEERCEHDCPCTDNHGDTAQ